MSERDKMTDSLGKPLATALLERVERLDPPIEDRLSAARAAAVQAAVDARQLAPELALAGADAKIQPGARRRWGMALPALLLVVGLVALQHSQWLQQTLGLADRDAALLRDDLPPNAYGDPGFIEYLDETPKEETPPSDEDEARR